ncbi:MAG: UDPGP type 1 family protein, partial [Kiritimatiellae bacterium]|nr:UDPGP type 1 family protein [Kiritimatiellia bacterium]
MEKEFSKIVGEGQSHILRFWDKLSDAEREALRAQVASLDTNALARMRKVLKGKGKAAAPSSPMEPAPAIELTDPTERAAAIARGEDELRSGRVAVVLVAGGQGSRLGFDGPKGAFPIGPITGAPLFHFHARKILAISRRYETTVPFYVMTSEVNDAATRKCFEEHGYFGLDKADVFFFRQGVWPAMDKSGKIILDAPGHIFMSPDGHGGILSALSSSGAIADMQRRSISTVFYFQVDNPLVDIADPAFIGLHLLLKSDISIKVCAKRDPQEGLGMMVVRDGHYEMVEYTELTEEQKNMRTDSGDLYYKYGSVAIHVFDFAFLKRETSAELPLHIAHKKIAFCADDGSVVKPDKPNGYKFEKFIFDVLPDAKTV